MTLDICRLLRGHSPCIASVILTWKRPFCSRHDAVVLFAVLGDDGVVAAVRYVRDDVRSAVVPVQQMYRSCIEATQPNDLSG